MADFQLVILYLKYYFPSQQSDLGRMNNNKYFIIFCLMILVGACTKKNPTSPVTNYSLAYAGDCQNCRIEYLGRNSNWVVYDTIGGIALYPPARIPIQSGFSAKIRATSNDSTKLYLIAMLAIKDNGDTAMYQIERPDAGIYQTELTWTAP